MMGCAWGCGWNDEPSGVGTVEERSPIETTAMTRPAFVQSPIVRKFITTLPGLGASNANNIGQFIPVATKKTREFAGLKTDVYDLEVSPFQEKMHPDLPAKTELYGYSDDRRHAAKQYLGGVIVATRNTPVLLTVKNELPDRTLVPVDLTLDVAEDGVRVGDLPFNRITTHLHGGSTPWFSDGTPFQWYTPHGQRGASFLNVPGTSPPHDSATYYYPNDLGARMIWYHDHAMGLTRTNVYSGIASAFIVTDEFEARLIKAGTLPDLGTPLVIQDKGFLPRNIKRTHPSWKWAHPGGLFYPSTYAIPPIPDLGAVPNTSGTGKYAYGHLATPPMNVPAMPLPKVSVVPEAFLDTPLVNGGVYPVHNVTDKRVRFRILNASNARFWHLNLFEESATSPGEPDLTKPGPAIIQFGTDGGFLPAWVSHPNGRLMPFIEPYPASVADPAGPFNLLLAPGERADVLIDFASWAGKKLVLYNDAPAPFPGGDARNDYFTGDLDLTAFGGALSTRPGFGPNTRTLMRFTVTASTPDVISTASVLTRLTAALASAFVDGEQPAPLFTGALPYTGPVNRRLTLNEDFDSFGRLIQRIGTDQNTGLTTSDGLTINGLNNQGLPTFGRAYLDPSTENPQRNAVETWELVNLSGDTHPMHFHLVNVQVIQRAAIDANMQPVPGTARPPDPNETGWKDTVRANPGEVLTVIMKFTLPTLPACMGDPVSPRTGGHEYVWHCHILEHEEHDMMRPLIVR
jgi:spore coat protein A